MDDHTRNLYNEPTSVFREVRERTSVIAFFLGMAIIAATILLGNTHALYISVLVFSFIITLLWRKAPRPWIFLVSITSATPIPLFRQGVACNLVFAFWFIALNVMCLSKLPKWIFVPTGLALIGVISSSSYWMTDNVIGSIMRQGAYAYNFLLAPLILLPVIYFRMEKSQDNAANLRGLLFYLIVPSTLILLTAKLMGTPANLWEASLHTESLSEGYIIYQLGKVLVNFTRTQVGFILAALICASTAIVVARVNVLYRLLSGTCMVSNLVLLLTTGSFGSGLACLCGLVAIFYAQIRVISIVRWITLIGVIAGILFLTYSLSPPDVKQYLEKRYEHRVNAGTEQDRFVLWGLGMDYFLENPGGVGLTFTVGDRAKVNIHNDFLTYAVSYGVTGGLAYAYLVAGLLIYFIRSQKRIIDDHSALAVNLAGLSVIVAVAVNSMTDHLTANRWYFNVIWSIIWYSYFCSRAAHSGPIHEGVESETAIVDQAVSH